MVPVTHFLALAAFLFAIGFAGVLVKKNAIIVFMCIELMLNAANLTFLAFARQQGSMSGQAIAFFVIAVAAAEVVVARAIFVALYRVGRTVDLNRLDRLKNDEVER